MYFHLHAIVSFNPSETWFKLHESTVWTFLLLLFIVWEFLVEKDQFPKLFFLANRSKNGTLALFFSFKFFHTAYITKCETN